jgi:hypothetical protein
MQGVIIETLSNRIIHDVEPVQIVGDLLLCVRDIAGEPIGAGNILRAGDGAHLGPVQRNQPTAVRPAWRQNWMNAALAPTIASGLSWRKAAMVR